MVTGFSARFLCHRLSLAVVEQENNKEVVWILKSSENRGWRMYKGVQVGTEGRGQRSSKSS